MPFRDRYAQDKSKRLYKDIQVQKAHGQQEVVELTNQLNGQQEVMSNNNKAVNANYSTALNDYIAWTGRELKENTKTRKAISEFISGDLVKITRAEMDNNLLEADNKYNTSTEGSNVKLEVAKREDERANQGASVSSTLAPTDQESVNIDSSAAAPTLSPSTASGGGTVTGGVPVVASESSGQPQSSTPVTEQAIVAESNIKQATTQYVSTISDRVTARTTKLKRTGLFKGSYNRGLARAAYADQVHNIESTITGALESDTRRVSVDLGNGQTWTGAINSVTMDDPVEVRESLVNFLKREQLSELGVAHGLSSKFVSEKLLSVANEKVRDMNKRYRTAWLLNDATNQKKGAFADLLSTARLGTSNDETLQALAKNTLAEITDANQDLMSAGFTAKGGKDTLQEFKDGIESIIEILHRDGQTAEIDRLIHAVSNTRAKFPWLGKKQGANEKGEVLLGYADKDLSLNGLKALRSRVESRIFKEKEEAKTVKATGFKNDYFKAVLEGDLDGQLQAKNNMRAASLHLDRPLIWAKMTNTEGIKVKGSQVEAIARKEIERFGTLTHKTIYSFDPAEWAAVKLALEKEGIIKDDTIVEFHYGDNINTHKDQIQTAQGIVKTFFNGKEGIKIANQLGSGNMQAALELAYDRLPYYAKLAKGVRESGSDNQQTLTGDEGTDIINGAKMFLAELNNKQEAYKNALAEDPNLEPGEFEYHPTKGFAFHGFKQSKLKNFMDNLSTAKQIYTQMEPIAREDPSVLLNLPYVPEDYYKSTDVRNAQGTFLNPFWYRMAELSNGKYTALTLARANALRSGNTLDYSGNETVETLETIEQKLRTRKDGSIILELPNPGTKAMDNRLEYGLGYVSFRRQNTVYTTYGAGFGGSGVNFGGVFKRKVTKADLERGFKKIVDVNNQLEAENISAQARINRSCIAGLAEAQGIKEIKGNWKTGDGFGIKGDKDVNGRPVVFGNNEIAIGYSRANNAYESLTGKRFQVLASSKSASNIKHTGVVDGTNYVKGETLDVGPETKQWLIENDPFGEQYGWKQHTIPDPNNPGQYLYNHFIWIGSKDFNPYHHCKVGI